MTSSKPASRTMAGKKANVGILAFEVASLMSKLLHIWRALSDAAVARLRHDIINLDGVRKVVSDDDAVLLALACAELADALRVAADSVAALASRCVDPFLREFGDAFAEFADTGRDRHRWAATSWKEMETRAHKMEKQVAATGALRRAMEELAEAEHGLRRLMIQSSNNNAGCHRRSMSASKISVAAEQQQVIFGKKQEVKQLRQTSLWACTFDAVVSSMARAAFTILARINLVFGGDDDHRATPLHRSLTLSSAVHPSVDAPPPHPMSRKSMSMEEAMFDHQRQSVHVAAKRRGYSSASAALVPPPGTLGAAALAPRYAGVIISIERMARSPRLVGPEERDELYGMLTASVRAQLRARLRGAVAAADPGLASQWRAALAGILDWLAPMAHATMRWQADRSFEHRKTATAAMGGGGVVLLLQTLQMADRGKVEAAVAELLVGLNYLWRFDKEMSCRALFAMHHHMLLDAAAAGEVEVDDDCRAKSGNGTVNNACV
uniref:DUF3475 domain-containing protein n=1 Tax=Leersia perrieri TaxID=77586 RepID=A0A0D9W1M3_9ORYZ